MAYLIFASVLVETNTSGMIMQALSSTVVYMWTIVNIVSW